MIKQHTIDAVYEGGPNTDYGYGYSSMMLSTWFYEITFTITTAIGYETIFEKIFKIKFSDREINDEETMLRIVRESLSKQRMSVSFYMAANDYKDEDITEEQYLLTPRAIETLEYLKTLVPKNVKMIENYILPNGR